MRTSAALCLVAAMAVAIGARAARASGLNPVTLTARALAAGQIRTVRLKRLSAAPRVAGYGMVLDPQALVRLTAQLIAARGAQAAASAQAVLASEQDRRARHLYRARHNISQAALQRARARLAVAEAQRATASAMLTQVRMRMLAQWGPRLAAAAVSGGAPLPALERGAVELIEISLPLGESLGQPPASASARCPDGARVRLRFLSRAPRTAAGVAGIGLLYWMRTQVSAPIGTPLTVSLEAAGARTGVRVPRSAVVWHHGAPWVFRQRARESFVPVALRGAFIAGRGYFVPERAGSALRAGQRIVARGAALVYSLAVQSHPRAKAAASGRPQARAGA